MIIIRSKLNILYNGYIHDVLDKYVNCLHVYGDNSRSLLYIRIMISI